MLKNLKKEPVNDILNT